MSAVEIPAKHPRIGIPYRMHKEEVSGAREKYEMYLRAVEKAGGAPVEISLALSSDELQKLANELDGIVLPGSPADVNPTLYRASRHVKTADADALREKTDFTLLNHCLSEGKPALAICYGTQILNVYLGGSLIQDIASEVPGSKQHVWEERERGATEPFHTVAIEAASEASMASEGLKAEVNSSHHQSVREPGRDLRITARVSDGIIEAVEWTGDENWIVGVQWHPERMVEDSFAKELFRRLIVAARRAAIRA